MATLDKRITALEATRKPALQILLVRGEPTPEQVAQIEQAERTGQPLRVIRFVVVTAARSTSPVEPLGGGR